MSSSSLCSSNWDCNNIQQKRNVSKRRDFIGSIIEILISSHQWYKWKTLRKLCNLGQSYFPNPHAVSYPDPAQTRRESNIYFVSCEPDCVSPLPPLITSNESQDAAAEAKLKPISVRKPPARTGQQFCYALDPDYEEAIQALLLYWSVEIWRPVNIQRWGQAWTWSTRSAQIFKNETNQGRKYGGENMTEVQHMWKPLLILMP